MQCLMGWTAKLLVGSCNDNLQHIAQLVSRLVASRPLVVWLALWWLVLCLLLRAMAMRTVDIVIVGLMVDLQSPLLLIQHMLGMLTLLHR